MSPSFYFGHILGHSSALNANWASGFAEQLQLGEYYPRWLPAMTGGGGSPVFYFYGPLPFYISAPFIILFGNAPLALAIASTILLIMSGFASYLLNRQYASPNAALIGSIIYMMMPYHFAYDIWARSAFGEQAAFVFMPLAAASILRLERDNRAIIYLALSFAGLVFSHAPSTILFAPVLIFLGLWSSIHQKNYLIILKSLLSAALAFGIVAVYLLPAVSLLNMVQQTQWATFEIDHALAFTLEASANVYFYPIWVATAFLGLIIYLTFRSAQALPNALPWILISFVVIIANTGLFAPIWRNAGFFKTVQFPWRALSIMDMATGVIIANLWHWEKRDHKIISHLVFFVLAFPLLIVAINQINYNDKKSSTFASENTVEQSLLDLKADGTEYLPACLQLPAINHRRLVTDEFAKKNIAATKIGQRPPAFYFPFLEVRQAGKILETSCDPKTGYLIWKGGNDTQPVYITRIKLPIENYGQMISSIGLILALLLFAYFQMQARSLIILKIEKSKV